MSALYEAQVDQVGEGHKILYRTSPGVPASTDSPGSAPFNVGDFMLNVNPTPGSAIGDRCVSAGIPGTWESVGTEIAIGFTLNNTQTKATNSAPVVIIPAQGAGTLIEICSMVLENIFLTAAFANGGALALYYGTSSAGVLASATIAATFLTSPAANQAILVAGALASSLSSTVLNTGICLANPTADFITGAGSLIGKIRYRVHSGL